MSVSFPKNIRNLNLIKDGVLENCLINGGTISGSNILTQNISSNVITTSYLLVSHGYIIISTGNLFVYDGGVISPLVDCDNLRGDNISSDSIILTNFYSTGTLKSNYVSTANLKFDNMNSTWFKYTSNKLDFNPYQVIGKSPIETKQYSDFIGVLQSLGINIANVNLSAINAGILSVFGVNPNITDIEDLERLLLIQMPYNSDDFKIVSSGYFPFDTNKLALNLPSDNSILYIDSGKIGGSTSFMKAHFGSNSTTLPNLKTTSLNNSNKITTDMLIISTSFTCGSNTINQVYSTFEDTFISTGNVYNLKSTFFSIQNLSIGNISGTNLHIDNIIGTHFSIQNLSIGNISGTNLQIDNSIYCNNAHITQCNTVSLNVSEDTVLNELQATHIKKPTNITLGSGVWLDDKIVNVGNKIDSAVVSGNQTLSVNPTWTSAVDGSKAYADALFSALSDPLSMLPGGFSVLGIPIAGMLVLYTWNINIATLNASVATVIGVAADASTKINNILDADGGYINIITTGSLETPIASIANLHSDNITVNSLLISNGNLNIFGNISHTGSSAICLSGGVDGGANKGIYFNSTTNPDWGIYFAKATTALNSLSGLTNACSGGNFSNYAVRLRLSNSSDRGFIIENSADDCLFSVRGIDAMTYFKGNIGVKKISPAFEIDVSGTIATDTVTSSNLYVKTKIFNTEYQNTITSVSNLKTDFNASIGNCVVSIGNLQTSLGNLITNFNSSIGNCNTSISNLKTSLGNLITNLNSSIGNCNTSISNLKTSLGSLITNLNSSLANINNTNISTNNLIINNSFNFSLVPSSNISANDIGLITVGSATTNITRATTMLSDLGQLISRGFCDFTDGNKALVFYKTCKISLNLYTEYYAY